MIKLNYLNAMIKGEYMDAKTKKNQSQSHNHLKS